MAEPARSGDAGALRAWGMGAAVAAALLAGCASGPGGRIGRDGAPSSPPPDLASVPDAEPRVEAVRASGGTSKPYSVRGRSYVPITDDRPFRERGLASWYGTGFHARSTASGEPYDMYAMTAAHKTLPLPSYVRVRNPANGREAIVRVNDRGPFHDGRIIDLSYTAALKLDLLRGVAPVEIERLTNEDIRTGAWRRDGGTQFASAAAAPSPAPAAAEPAQAVAVPPAWVAPVAATPTDRSQALVLAQAPAEPAPPGTASDSTAPPPRFRSMQVDELPPMTPASAATPPPTPAAPAAAPAPQDAAATAGFWVQLGAFRERDGAEGLQAQAGRTLPALAPQLRVFSESGTHRLQAGPYPSREAAAAAQAQLRDGLRLAPIVVERR